MKLSDGGGNAIEVEPMTDKDDLVIGVVATRAGWPEYVGPVKLSIHQAKQLASYLNDEIAKINRVEVKRFDIEGNIKYKLDNKTHSFLDAFAGSVANELRKVEIKTKLQLRKHKFDDGEMGEVADRLLIQVDFKDAVVQPHTHFEEDFCDQVCNVLECEINGLFENSEE